MIASEFAFLALGLVLGVASGSALVMVLGSRPPAHEVRLTVGHDAVPRRAATLSSDAFITSPAEPARAPEISVGQNKVSSNVSVTYEIR